jgi:hypothetical protein
MQRKLDDALSEKGIRLPDDYYNYLINVSCDFLMRFDNMINGNYPIFYDDERNTNNIECIIKDLPLDEHCQIEIPINVTNISFYFPECPISEKDIPRTISHNFTCKEISKSMLHISDGSKYHIYPYMIYLGKGHHFGSVWVNGDDSLCGEFPEYVKVFSTFTQFFDRINKLRKTAIRDEGDYYILCEDDSDTEDEE